MSYQIIPERWELYADETDHYSYVRCLAMSEVYEVVRVTHEKHGQQAEFVHQVIFMNEYAEPALDEILRGFGYKSLDAFVREVNHADGDPAGFITGPDGKTDREASSGWWIDYMLLASLMAERFDGRTMAAQVADDLARAIVGVACGEPIPLKRPPVVMCPAMYAVTVIRQRTEGRHTESYQSCFLIERNKLVSPSERDCEEYLRRIVRDFLHTADGKQAYEASCHNFNWGDVETDIPDDFLSAYGVSRHNGEDGPRRFLCCGMFGILVDQDELLGRDVYDDEGTEDDL